MAALAGLRSQTPISQTASKPNLAMSSHSAEGTEPKSTAFPYFCFRSQSQTQVLTSYSVGYRGQNDMLISRLGVPVSVFRREGQATFHRARLREVRSSLGQNESIVNGSQVAVALAGLQSLETGMPHSHL